MEVSIGIVNRLQGTEPQIDDDNGKKIIFETFPSTWQDDFHKSGKTEATQEFAGNCGLHECMQEAGRCHRRKEIEASEDQANQQFEQ